MLSAGTEPHLDPWGLCWGAVRADSEQRTRQLSGLEETAEKVMSNPFILCSEKLRPKCCDLVDRRERARG